MADILPLRGLRYTHTDNLSACITQPYDKINSQLKKDYQKRSANNLVHLLLPEAEGTHSIYEKSAQCLKKWREKNILACDSAPSLYPYRQSFTYNTSQHVRSGFICRVHIEDYCAKIIYPHERTLAGPREDRLNLLKATRTHFGLIFLLYEDDGTVQSLIDEEMQKNPLLAAKDDFEVTNEVWQMSEPAKISEIEKAMASRALFIADGHHRYETSRVYARENPHDPAAQYTLAMCVNINSPLIVLPTHRSVRGLQNYAPQQCKEELAQYFTITAAVSNEEMMNTVVGADGNTIIGWYDGSDYYTLELKSPEIMTKEMPDASNDLRGLDVAVLHTLILEKTLGITPDKMEHGGMVGYHRDPHEAIEMVEDAEAQCAFFLKATSPAELCNVARNGGVMPQKSTDFYPKLISGMIMYALDCV